ncbi:hypothetical protein G6F68_014927 [Rhizopus microsporus]|nr:hypothetical protein G6F68_014927 [Rhizopus microsporus]
MRTVGYPRFKRPRQGLKKKKSLCLKSQIWDYVKQAEKEEDAASLKTVIDLIFDKACDEPAFAVMWAQLAMKLYELTTANENIKNVNILDEKTKKPVCGGPLYRKYLLIRCQSDFYKGQTSWPGSGPVHW